MPYQSNEDLPRSIREHLPSHAQDIFREAFNHSYASYGGDESIAFRVAWAAVKHRFERSEDGSWLPRR
jgi:cation transport regulator